MSDTRVAAAPAGRNSLPADVGFAQHHSNSLPSESCGAHANRPRRLKLTGLLIASCQPPFTHKVSGVPGKPAGSSGAPSSAVPNTQRADAKA